MVVKRAGSPAANGAPEGAHDGRREADHVDETSAGAGAGRAPEGAPATGSTAQADAAGDAVVAGAGSSDAASTDGTSADATTAGTAADATPADPTAADEVPPAPVQALDPRAIARASLEASRNASLWWTSAGVVVAMVVALVVGTRAGSYTLAAMLAACALVRAVRPHPGPIAISVRAKAIDVTVLTTLAVSIAVLTQLLPGRTI